MSDDVLNSRSDGARAFLLRMRRSRTHTVQWMPDPPRWEVIFVGPGPHPNNDPRCGDLQATIYVDGDDDLRLVTHGSPGPSDERTT